MKTFKPILLIALLAVGCTSWATDKLTGNGNVTQQERHVSSFTEIETAGVFNVYLSEGPAEMLKIETDENLQDIVLTKVSNNKLFVTMKDGVNLGNFSKINVYITFKALERLQVEGVGNVYSNSQLHLDHFDLQTAGVGNTNLDLSCNYLTAKIDGVGNLSLKGTATEAILESNSVGNIKAFDLVTDKLTITQNGVGNAEVMAQKEIYISSSGLGNVKYKGDPIVKKLDDSGIGKVKKI